MVTAAIRKVDEPPRQPSVVENVTPTKAAPVSMDLACKDRPSFTVSYDQPVQIRRIAKDTVEKMGMKVGPLDVIPANEKRSWYWAHTGPSALSTLSRKTDWTWFIAGDTVKFRKRNDTSQVQIYETLDASFRVVGGNLELALDTDFPDDTEITIAVKRVYQAKDHDGDSEAYSHEYSSKCGTVAQWRVNNVLPIDEAEWKSGLEEYQDKMTGFGKDMAFEIVGVDDHLTVSTSGGQPQRLTDEDRVLKPREAVTRVSLHVPWNELEPGRAYSLMLVNRDAPLMPMSGSGAKMVRLAHETVVEVQAVENSTDDIWYLVSAGERWGWINSVVLMSDGAVQVPSAGEQDSERLVFRREIREHVLVPCLGHAYRKVVRSNPTVINKSRKPTVMRAMTDASIGLINQFIDDAIDLELNILPFNDRKAFYHTSLEACIAGT